jgi:hypothetical protein
MDLTELIHKGVDPVFQFRPCTMLDRLEIIMVILLQTSQNALKLINSGCFSAIRRIKTNVLYLRYNLQIDSLCIREILGVFSAALSRGYGVACLHTFTKPTIARSSLCIVDRPICNDSV